MLQVCMSTRCAVTALFDGARGKAWPGSDELLKVLTDSTAQSTSPFCPVSMLMSGEGNGRSRERAFIYPANDHRT